MTLESIVMATLYPIGLGVIAAGICGVLWFFVDWLITKRPRSMIIVFVMVFLWAAGRVVSLSPLMQ